MYILGAAAHAPLYTPYVPSSGSQQQQGLMLVTRHVITIISYAAVACSGGDADITIISRMPSPEPAAWHISRSSHATVAFPHSDADITSISHGAVASAGATAAYRSCVTIASSTPWRKARDASIQHTYRAASHHGESTTVAAPRPAPSPQPARAAVWEHMRTRRGPAPVPVLALGRP